MASRGAGEIDNLRFHPLYAGELVAHAMHEKLARGGQSHSMRQPLEDRNAEFCLCRQNAALERRVRGQQGLNPSSKLHRCSERRLDYR